ncbi:MAG: glycosyltransferase N-terminal domain-containing protein [Acidobacteriota bacterium]
MEMLWQLIYLLLLFLSFPYFLCNKILKKKEFPVFLRRLGFNLKKDKKEKKRIWIHAVSLGEVLLTSPIISKIKELGKFDVYITTTTQTGYQVATERLSGIKKIFFSPLDIRFSVKKYLNFISPDILILVENEIWPTLILETRKRNIPILLINGRMSDRTFKYFNFFKSIIKPIVNKIDYFLVQDNETYNKYKILGISEEKLQISGNLKADTAFPFFTENEIEILKSQFNLKGKKIFVAGSTSKGEENTILEAYLKAKKANDDLKLILAPRHPNRFEEVERIIKKYKLKMKTRTSFQNKEYDVLLLNTIGELCKFYAISNGVFVGGSLVSKGGHNILEPAFYSKPICFGKYMSNFKNISEIFLKKKASILIKNEKDLVNFIKKIDSEELKSMGIRAYKTYLSLKGGTEKTIDKILSLI